MRIKQRIANGIRILALANFLVAVLAVLVGLAWTACALGVGALLMLLCADLVEDCL